MQVPADLRSPRTITIRVTITHRDYVISCIYRRHTQSGFYIMQHVDSLLIHSSVRGTRRICDVLHLPATYRLPVMSCMASDTLRLSVMVYICQRHTQTSHFVLHRQRHIVLQTLCPPSASGTHSLSEMFCICWPRAQISNCAAWASDPRKLHTTFCGQQRTQSLCDVLHLPVTRLDFLICLAYVSETSRHWDILHLLATHVVSLWRTTLANT